MKTEKMKVMLYLKKSGMDKSGKAPIMGQDKRQQRLATTVGCNDRQDYTKANNFNHLYNGRWQGNHGRRVGTKPSQRTQCRGAVQAKYG